MHGFETKKKKNFRTRQSSHYSANFAKLLKTKLVFTLASNNFTQKGSGDKVNAAKGFFHSSQNILYNQVSFHFNSVYVQQKSDFFGEPFLLMGTLPQQPFLAGVKHLLFTK